MLLDVILLLPSSEYILPFSFEMPKNDKHALKRKLSTILITRTRAQDTSGAVVIWWINVLCAYFDTQIFTMTPHNAWMSRAGSFKEVLHLSSTRTSPCKRFSAKMGIDSIQQPFDNHVRIQTPDHPLIKKLSCRNDVYELLFISLNVMEKFKEVRWPSMVWQWPRLTDTNTQRSC